MTYEADAAKTALPARGDGQINFKGGIGSVTGSSCQPETSGRERASKELCRRAMPKMFVARRRSAKRSRISAELRRSRAFMDAWKEYPSRRAMEWATCRKA